MKLVFSLRDSNSFHEGLALYDTRSMQMEIFWAPNIPHFDTEVEALDGCLIKKVKEIPENTEITA